MPSAGRSANVATRGPHIAPVVLASVSHPAARAWSGIARSSSWPRSVNNTPDRTAVGTVNAHANQRIRCHSPAWVPAVRTWNISYDTAEAQPAASATAGMAVGASGRHLSQPDAARPPRPIAASTAASITLAARVLLVTNIDRNRNHRISSASRLPPARNAPASGRHAASIAGGDPAARSGTGWVGLRRRDTHSAMTAAPTLRTAANHALPRTPSRATNTISAASTPATAPIVFQPYKRPSTRP